MKHDPLKVAIVGCGRIADGHVEQIRRLRSLARVVAACDREPIMAEQLCLRYEIPGVYRDYQTMLARERPDVVHITTPPASHVPLAREALDAGCHVYVEKPLAPRHRDALALLEHAQQRDRKITVGYTYLFDPPALAMRELIAQGVVGEAVHVESVYGYDLHGSFGRALLSDQTHWVHQLPGKLLHNTIDHLINRLAEFVDSEEPEVLALGRQLAPRRSREPLLDEMRAIIAGSRVTAQATFSAHARPVMHHFRVYGTRNTLHLDFLGRTLLLERTPPLPSALGRLLAPVPDIAALTCQVARNALRFARSDFHFFAGLHELIRRFYLSIQHGGPVPISHRDMAWVSAVMDRIFEQIVPQARLELWPPERVA